MDTETKTFWISVIAGIVVMLGFAVVTVNVYHLIPIINPFIGGLITGFIARRGALYGGKAGVVAGVAGGSIVFFDYLNGAGFFWSITAPVAALTGSLFLIVLIPYFAILAFMGGVVGGQVRY